MHLSVYTSVLELKGGTLYPFFCHFFGNLVRVRPLRSLYKPVQGNPKRSHADVVGSVAALASLLRILSEGCISGNCMQPLRGTGWRTA